MRKNISKQAQCILDAYVERLKSEKGNNGELVTTYCYDNFAQGVKAVMPDVTEDVIDSMYQASGFGISKYRGGYTANWFADGDKLVAIAGVIDAVLANVGLATPMSLADMMACADIKLCRDNRDYYDRKFSDHKNVLTCQRAINALVDANLVTKTAIKTCGKVHIYLYTIVSK